MSTSAVVELIEDWTQLDAAKIAVQLSDTQDVQHYGESLTWAQLNVLCHQRTLQLQEAGVSQGDRWLCVGRNEFELVLSYLACQSLGAVCVIVNRFPKAQLAEIARQVGAKGELVHQHVQPQLASNALRIPPCDLALSSAPLCSTSDIAFPEASVILSSGSSGAPKALVHDSNAHIGSARGVIELMDWQASDNALMSLPLYHVSGLALMWRWLVSGSCLSFGTMEHDFATPVTITSMVMTQLSRWIASDSAKSPIKVLLGGSYLEPALIEKAQSLGARCFVGYAMSEMASTITAKEFDGKSGSGACLSQRELKLVDGQIMVRGPMLASGMLVNGKLTPLALTDGWYATKDLGEWHDGDILVLGRQDNQFISGGENIHCEEVERALMASGYFEQVMVLPVPDEEFGHRPVALYHSSQGFERQAIEVQLAKTLIKFKWPIAYHRLPEELVNGVKLNRRHISQWFEARIHDLNPQ